MPVRRFAVYYAPPPEAPLAVFAAAWLGRDADGGAPVAQPAIAGIASDRLAELTADPRRYGFHATLKPPFALAQGKEEAALLKAVAAFAATCRPVSLPALELRLLDGFLALVPAVPVPALDRLARDCVIAFDDFRALPSAAELARRRQAGLSPRQEGLLARWGYPYVFDQFRFHLTLTRRLSGEEARIVMPLLAPLVAPLTAAPVMIDGLAVFEEPRPGAPFTVRARFAFAAGNDAEPQRASDCSRGA